MPGFNPQHDLLERIARALEGRQVGVASFEQRVHDELKAAGDRLEALLNEGHPTEASMRSADQAYDRGVQAGIDAERERILSAPATPSAHEANRTIEFNKGFKAGSETVNTDTFEQGWHDGHTAGYELGYNDAFNVAANADENIDLRTQALEMAIAASAGGVYGDTVTTIAAAFLHFLKTGAPYTGPRVLIDDIG